MTRSIVSRSIGLVAWFGLIILANWLTVPAWSFSSGLMYLFAFVMAIIGILVFAICENIADDDRHICTIITAGLAALLLLVMVVGLCCSGAMFNANAYHQLITIDDGAFEQDVPKVEAINNVPIVDVATAQNVGDRTIAGLKNSSWYEVDDEYNLIVYKGKQYRISALSYGGFFKYEKAKQNGIPGYVLVDVLNQEATLVELENPIRYAPSAYFNQDLTRHLRNQFPNAVFGTEFFEIDDDGNPYWITSIKSSKIGFWGGKKEESFIVTDACTGASSVYTVETLPAWVDHAVDLEYVMDTINNHYRYVNGWWNPSNTGVYKTSYSYRGGEDKFEGYTSMVVNGEVVFYTGVTPASGAESNLGFLFVSARTGKVTYYDCAGAEESSAKHAAEGLVQNLGYKATFPTMLNVDGEATYIMVLKDGAGLIQRYALCNVKNYTLVVEATSLAEALSKYRERILQTEPSEPDELAKSEEKSGKILELTEVQIEGYTYYCFKFEGDNKMYMSSIVNSSRQAFMEVGTTVTIEYVSSKETDVFMVTKITIN